MLLYLRFRCSMGSVGSAGPRERLTASRALHRLPKLFTPNKARGKRSRRETSLNLPAADGVSVREQLPIQIQRALVRIAPSAMVAERIRRTKPLCSGQNLSSRAQEGGSSACCIRAKDLVINPLGTGPFQLVLTLVPEELVDT